MPRSPIDASSREDALDRSRSLPQREAQSCDFFAGQEPHDCVRVLKARIIELERVVEDLSHCRSEIRLFRSELNRIRVAFGGSELPPAVSHFSVAVSSSMDYPPPSLQIAPVSKAKSPPAEEGPRKRKK